MSKCDRIRWYDSLVSGWVGWYGVVCGGWRLNGMEWCRWGNRDSIALKGMDVLSDLRKCY